VLAAYPITQKQAKDEGIAGNYYRSNSLTEKGEGKIQRWKVVQKPEHISDAASQPGALFAEDIDELKQRIDRRLRAPIGCTYHHVPEYRYNPKNDQPSMLMTMDRPSVTKSAGVDFSRAGRWSRLTDDVREKVLKAASRIARNHGACYCPVYLDGGRLELYGNAYVISNTPLGACMTYDPERFKRVRKRRSSDELRTKKGDGKPAPAYTAKQVLINMAEEIFRKLWFSELSTFASVPTSQWGQWQWQTSRVSESIMDAHKLAVKLGKVQAVRAIYRKWLPHLPVHYKRLKGYGVREEFTEWCDKQLQFGKRSGKKSKKNTEKTVVIVKSTKKVTP